MEIADTDLSLGIGARLRQAREKQGTSIEQCAERLYLPGSVLEALESEQFASLGASVYARGHLRRYASLLDIDGAALEQLMLQRLSAPPDIGSIVTRRPIGTRAVRRMGILPVAIVAIVVALVALVWWSVRHAPAEAPAQRSGQNIGQNIGQNTGQNFDPGAGQNTDQAPGQNSGQIQLSAAIPAATSALPPIVSPAAPPVPVAAPKKIEVAALPVKAEPAASRSAQTVQPAVPLVGQSARPHGVGSRPLPLVSRKPVTPAVTVPRQTRADYTDFGD